MMNCLLTFRNYQELLDSSEKYDLAVLDYEAVDICARNFAISVKLEDL